MPPKKNNRKKAYKKTRGLPTAVAQSETKLQKQITDLSVSPYDTPYSVSFWTTPYQRSFTNPALFLNPQTEVGGVNNSCAPPIALGSFIQNGNERDQRNGRRITMMSSTLDIVCHLRTKNTGTVEAPVYSYNINPEFRIVSGWIKGGLGAMGEITTDISSLYSEIPFSKYKIVKDYILSRTGRSGS